MCKPGPEIFLFAGPDSGGERAAAMYALIGTCTLNDIDRRAYLGYVDLQRFDAVSKIRLLSGPGVEGLALPLRQAGHLQKKARKPVAVDL